MSSSYLIALQLATGAYIQNSVPPHNSVSQLVVNCVPSQGRSDILGITTGVGKGGATGT